MLTVFCITMPNRLSHLRNNYFHFCSLMLTLSWLLMSYISNRPTGTIKHEKLFCNNHTYMHNHIRQQCGNRRLVSTHINEEFYYSWSKRSKTWGFCNLNTKIPLTPHFPERSTFFVSYLKWPCLVGFHVFWLRCRLKVQILGWICDFHKSWSSKSSLHILSSTSLRRLLFGDTFSCTVCSLSEYYRPSIYGTYNFEALKRTNFHVNIALCLAYVKKNKTIRTQ